MKLRVLVALTIVAMILTVIPQSVVAQKVYRRVVVERFRVPAVYVGSNGKFHGVLSNLTIAVAWPGEGIVYFSAEPLTELDTQAAARLAALVASVIAGVNYNNYDFFVRLQTTSTTIGGPSASAAMAVAILAALTGAKLAEKASMTGMIEPDGTIGPVGGVPEKLRAAARAGVKLFLVPKGQLVVVDPNTGERVDLEALGAELGVKVIAVGSILDAYRILTGKTITVPNISLAYPVWLKENLLGAYNEFKSIAETNITCARSLLQRLSSDVAHVVARAVNESSRALSDAEKLLDEGKYYAAAYRAFYAAYEALFACSLAKAGSTASLATGRRIVIDLVRAARSNMIKAYRMYESLKSVKLTDRSLQILVTLYERIRDTNMTLNLIPEEKSIAEMIRDASYAYVRSLTALQWANLLRQVKGGIPIDASQLRRADYMLLDYATLVSSYLAVLAGVTPISTTISTARRLLASGDYIAAASLAVEALSRYSMMMHRMFNTTRVLAPYAAEVTKLIIYRVKELGATPVLPLAYMELAKIMSEPVSKIALYEDAAAYSLLLYTLLQRKTTPPPATGKGAATVTITTTVTRTITATGTGRTRTVTKTSIVTSTVTSTVTSISTITSTVLKTRTVVKTVPYTKTIVSTKTVTKPVSLGAIGVAAIIGALIIGLLVGAAIGRASVKRE